MEKPFQIILLTKVEKFVLTLSHKEGQKVSGAINALRNKKFDTIYIKQLRGDIKELKVKRFRLIFFIYNNIIYITQIFVKKTNKTPSKEIELAEKYLKNIIKS